MAVYKKILVTLDRSRVSEAVLSEVRKLLDGAPAEVTLLTVGRSPRATRRPRGGPSRPTPLGTGQLGSLTDSVLEAAPPRYAETKDQAVQRKEHEQLKYLDSLTSSIRETGSTVKLVGRLGDPAREIIDFAQEGGFDLIAMATHGRSGLSEIVQGSIAEAVVRSGVAPVLLVRPRKT
jgi:nucleotide-binding universal stress UspA family protein